MSTSPSVWGLSPHRSVFYDLDYVSPSPTPFCLDLPSTPSWTSHWPVMPTRCRRELGVWRYISVDRVTTVELFRQNFQTNTVKQLFLLLYYKVTIKYYSNCCTDYDYNIHVWKLPRWIKDFVVFQMITDRWISRQKSYFIIYLALIDCIFPLD